MIWFNLTDPWTVPEPPVLNQVDPNEWHSSAQTTIRDSEMTQPSTARAFRIQEPLKCKKAADYLEDESVEEEPDGGEEGDE